MPIDRILALGAAAADAQFDQLWVTDNLVNRDPFVVLGALAGIVDIRLGTAVSVQYLRSPLLLAMSAITVSEVMDGRPLVIGLGAGNPFTGRSIAVPRQAAFMRETATFLRRLWAGEEVVSDHFPLIAGYFHLTPKATFALPAPAAGPLRLFGGGNGPRGLSLAGELLDGLIFGWRSLLEARLGTLAEKLQVVDQAAARAGRDRVGRVMEVKVSVARDGESAREFVRSHAAATLVVSLRRRGYGDEALSRLGIDPAVVTVLDTALAAGARVDELAHLVTDAMVDATFVAGDPAQCRSGLAQVVEIAHDHGFDQVILSELGPDPLESIGVIREQLDILTPALLPSAQGTAHET